MDIIHQKIKKYGVKQAHLARKLGISRAYLTQMLKGDRDLSEDYKKRLLELLPKD